MATVRALRLPTFLFTRDLTLGQSDTCGLLMRQMETAYEHVELLNRSTFKVGLAYLPFAPKGSFEVRSRYRFSGKMPVLPFHLDLD
jgi:hypothetical protein